MTELENAGGKEPAGSDVEDALVGADAAEVEKEAIAPFPPAADGLACPGPRRACG
jgi:hypothetical protein